MATYTSTFDGTENPLVETTAWAQIGAVNLPQKVSGVLNPQATGIEAWAKYVGAVFDADQSSEITISALTNTNDAVIAMARVAGTRGYFAYWIYGDGFYLFRKDGLTSTTQLAGPITATAFTASRRLRLFASFGGALTVYDNDVAVIATSDFTYTDGQPGVGIYASSAISDVAITAWTGVSYPIVTQPSTFYRLTGSRAY